MEYNDIAIAIANKSFAQDSDSICGISAMGMQASNLFYNPVDSREGARALSEKRSPTFR